MPKVDFKTKGVKEGWYDVTEDWDLIESSLAKQYGIRIRHNTDMQWTEFCSLISGLMADTPLGQVVGIRSETDPETIKQFNNTQKRIHRDWQMRSIKNKLADSNLLDKQSKDLELLFSKMFG